MAFVTFPLLRAESSSRGEWDAVSARQAGTTGYIGVDYSTSSSCLSFSILLLLLSFLPFWVQSESVDSQGESPALTVLPLVPLT